jgi:ABC-type nickel/cobalt efflux system permease component RcnA
MVLFFVLAGIAVVLLIGVGLWFLVPTVRTFGHPDFEPTPKDDESVFQAQQTFTVDGGQ